jgi:hypothetical protein
MRRLLLAPLLVALLSGCNAKEPAPKAGALASQATQSAPAASSSAVVANEDAPVTGPVVLKLANAGKKDIDDFPVIVPGPAVSKAAAERINAALARDRSRVGVAAADCVSSYKEANDGKTEPDIWTRGVQVNMAGPRFLSLWVADDMNCGGPHPDVRMLSLVYDLSTGAPVDWLKLFPAGAKAELSEAADGSKIGFVLWPELDKRLISAAEADCKDVFTDEPVRYLIELNAKDGVLWAVPGDLPHVSQGCGNPVELRPAELRRLGFAPALVDALEAAHAMQGRR